MTPAKVLNRIARTPLPLNIQVLGWILALVLASLGVFTLCMAGASHAADGKAESPGKGVLRFGHQAHAAVGIAMTDCQNCHAMRGFEVEPVTRGLDHKPCNNAECHASEYMSRAPTICVVCHESNQPWIKQQARIREHAMSEFGGEISHRTHLSEIARRGGVTCASCHGAVYEAASKQQAHAVCGSCHQGSLKPVMGDCGACHRLGDEGSGARPTSAYSVRARFDHSDHWQDPRASKSGAPQCKLCHADVARASTLAEIPAPTMQSCDACHDGKHAFKTTGFGCVKCHGAAKP